ncbi:MAG: DUF1045 domain-containing protein [Gluconacetobacter sp.]|uniref:DUF1045 domain-containing protein n=1 Tax=Gluconacetobacter dulcium TaxID=2729096 RepID=A0A7W4JY98_9PROT|nr:DUF1045 domain-containing protein [Gluconacetobacter dulcium]MBB2196860.1 DUF1045 domain-containing protein [Gluconacetobacter dulcium]
MSSDTGARYALYYAPEPSDALWRAGCAWLGRDPATGLPVEMPGLARRAPLTRSATRYGFHATLKAPMALNGPVTAFLDDVAAFAASSSPFALPALRIVEEGGFTALRPAAPCPALQAFGDDCVRVFDTHRRPEDPQRTAERAGRCTDRQKALLHRWGYPYVFDEWHFHMTLADSVLPPDIRGEMDALFTPALARERMVASLCVFHEPRPGAPFTLLARCALGGGA